MLCSECFKNEGLKLEAQQIGSDDNSICKNCTSSTGKKLTDEQLHLLMQRFFVHGSVPQNVGGYASVYRWSDNREMESVTFRSALQLDYELIRERTGLVLFHYGPPLWRLGLTDHYEALEGGQQEVSQALDDIIERSVTITLPVDSKLYRVRSNMRQDPLLPSSFDTPPDSVRTKNGRFDTLEIPVFYAAWDVETCLHECRVVVADEITLATLRTNQELRLINIADSFKEKVGSTPFENIEVLMNKLCGTNELEYPKCRLIAEGIRHAGYDGFKFKSYYSQVKTEPLSNIALFGHPIAEEKLKLESVNRVKLEQVNYAYSLGPVFEDQVC